MIARQSIAFRVARLEAQRNASRCSVWLRVVYAAGESPARIADLEAAASAAHTAEHGVPRAPGFVHRVLVAPPKRGEEAA